MVELNGRDLTAPMIDTKTVQKYPNLTSSQIVAQIAASHGLKTNITATSTKVGTYYEIDHIQLQDDRTEWDLLTYLARQETYVVFVSGNTLNFVPQPTASGTPYRFVFSPPTASGPASGNFTALKLEQAKTLANDVKVIVHSWDRKNGRGYNVTATASHVQTGFKKSGNTTKNGGPQIYSRTIPNLAKDQAQARANQLLIELSKHELKIEIDGPADMTLDRLDTISLTGTGTAFDTTYFPSAIIRSLSAEGFTWRVMAKNQSPETTTVV